jgi:hypothetical protein
MGIFAVALLTRSFCLTKFRQSSQVVEVTANGYADRMARNIAPKVTPDRRGFWGGVVSTMEIQPNTPSFKPSRAVQRRSQEQNMAEVRRDWESVGDFLRVALDQAKYSR